MKVITFQTDAANVAGEGTEVLTGEAQIPISSLSTRGIRILQLKQPAGAVLANDADWQMRRNRGLTGDAWLAESLDPVNGGGVDLRPRGITVGPTGTIGFAWFGQGAAQANQLQVFYESL